MTITIRPLAAQDIEATAAWLPMVPLLSRYGMTSDAATRLLSEACSGGDVLFAADHVRIGPASGVAWCQPRGAFGRSPYLRLIAVRPEGVGLGIGSALLGAVEERARALGEDLFLLVSDFNAGARRFYRRHGYEQVGAIPGYVLPDVTEILMRKRLR